MSSPTTQFYRGISGSTLSGVAKVKASYQQLPQLYKNLILVIALLALISVSSLIVSFTVGANGVGGLLTSPDPEEPVAEQQAAEAEQGAPAASESVTDQNNDITVDNNSSLDVKVESNSTTSNGQTQSGSYMTVNGHEVEVPNDNHIRKRIKSSDGNTSVNISINNTNSGSDDE